MKKFGIVSPPNIDSAALSFTYKYYVESGARGDDKSKLSLSGQPICELMCFRGTFH